MEPGIDRPQSALARGVQITEFNESQVNPEPVVIEETDLLMEQYLSPRKLVSLQYSNSLPWFEAGLRSPRGIAVNYSIGTMRHSTEPVETKL